MSGIWGLSHPVTAWCGRYPYPSTWSCFAGSGQVQDATSFLELILIKHPCWGNTCQTLLTNRCLLKRSFFDCWGVRLFEVSLPALGLVRNCVKSGWHKVFFFPAALFAALRHGQWPVWTVWAHATRIPVVRFHGKMQVSNIRIKHPDSMLSVSSASGLASKLLVPLDLIWPGCGKQCICLRTSCKFTPETVSQHVGVYLTSISSPGHTVCLSYALAWRRIVRHICTNERGQIQRVWWRMSVYAPRPFLWREKQGRPDERWCFRICAHLDELVADAFLTLLCPHGAPGVLCRFTSASRRISGWVVAAADTARHFRGPGFRPVRRSAELVASPVVVALNDGGVLEVHERAAVLPGTLQVPAQGFATLLRYPRSGSPHHPTSWREFNLLFSSRLRPRDGCMACSHRAAEAPPLPSVGGKKCIAAGSVVAAICAPTSVDNYREFADPGHSTHLPCRAGHGALFSGTRSHGSIARNFYLGRNAVKTSILKCGFDHEDKYLESMKEEQSEDLRTSAASRSDVPGAREHSSKGMV